MPHKPLEDSAFLSSTLDSSAVLRALNIEKTRGYARLRFAPMLERVFTDDLTLTGNRARIIIFSVGAVVAIILPALIRTFLGTPANIAQYINPLTFGVAPIMLCGAIAVWRFPLSNWTYWICVLAYLAVGASILIQRTLSASDAYDVPLMWIATITTAFIVSARLRFWHALPWVVLVVAASVVNDLLFVVKTPNDLAPLTLFVELVLIAAVGGYSLEYFVRKTWVDSHLLDYVSNHDGLTGLLNRDAFERVMLRLLSYAHRTQCAVGIAMVDVDHFKKYNDTHGHQAGDDALRCVTHIMTDAARRPMDVCGRYGGEEFVIIWVGREHTALRQLAEDMRACVEHTHTACENYNLVAGTTISVGLQIVDVGNKRAVDYADHRAVSRYLDMADQLLYKAKSGGRNQVAYGVI